MEKISGQDATIVLSEASKALRSLSWERDQLAAVNSELRQKVASFELDQRVKRVSSMMEERGLDNGLDAEQRIALLREKAAGGKLDVFEEAIGLQAPDMPFGRVSGGPSKPSSRGSLADVLLQGV